MEARSLVLERALDLVLSVVGECGGKVAEEFKTRARQMASDVAFSGLPVALAVVAARSSAKALEQALQGAEPREFASRVCNDEIYAKKELGLEKSEEKSYALYGFALLRALKEAGLAKSGKFSEFLKAEAFDSAVQEYATQAAVWIKRFAEAYIK